uniref:Ras-associating domain-containing protein n=1 Tax=Steinernema glaseri TaxID=37863 RepID=A0A1I7ZB56_9BILA
MLTHPAAHLYNHRSVCVAIHDAAKDYNCLLIPRDYIKTIESFTRFAAYVTNEKKDGHTVSYKLIPREAIDCLNDFFVEDDEDLTVFEQYGAWNSKISTGLISFSTEELPTVLKLLQDHIDKRFGTELANCASSPCTVQLLANVTGEHAFRAVLMDLPSNETLLAWTGALVQYNVAEATSFCQELCCQAKSEKRERCVLQLWDKYAHYVDDRIVKKFRRIYDAILHDE